MKKLVAILLAGVMTFGMAVTAFAAPSPEADTKAGNVASVQADLPAGVTVVTNTDYDTPEEKAAADAITADAKAIAKELGLSGADNLKLNKVFNLALSNGEDFTGKATITFNVPGLTPNSVAYVLHYENGKWVDVTTSKGNGTITATFANGFSPTAILVDESTLSKTAATSNGSSPKTGEAPYMAVMFAIAAAAVAGMAISRKRFA